MSVRELAVPARAPLQRGRARFTGAAARTRSERSEEPA
jgi:hypothetical protein